MCALLGRKGCVWAVELLLITPARTLLPGGSARWSVLPAAIQVSPMSIWYVFLFTYLFCQRILFCPQGSRKHFKIVAEETPKRSGIKWWGLSLQTGLDEPVRSDAPSLALSPDLAGLRHGVGSGCWDRYGHLGNLFGESISQVLLITPA